MEDVRDEISGWPIGSGYYSTQIGTDEAAEIARAVLALIPEPPTGDAEAEAERRYPKRYWQISHPAFVAGAAWQAQRPREVVTTAAELDALPVGSVVMDPFAAVCTRVTTGMEPFDWRRVTTAVKGGEHRHAPYLPATVIHRPEGTP